MRTIISLFFLFLTGISFSKTIEGITVNDENSESLPFSSISVEYPDSTITFISDMDGRFSFNPASFPLTVKATQFGMKQFSSTIYSEPDSVVVLRLSPDATVLQEYTVVGKLTTQTDSGISYNMAANKRAQSENTLQSLSYVPLVNVDANGSISVQGSSSFKLYLNGRPYDMAQTSPKIFLESLPAASIKKVEVITRPDNRYGLAGDSYILNIVLKQPVFDGYVLNLNGGGNTQPSANGAIMGMLKKGNIDLSLNYDYNMNGQKDQYFNLNTQEKDNDGNVIREWNNHSRGDGYWHTHTIRALLKWEIDSLNSIYLDGHGRINQNNFTQNDTQTLLLPETEYPETSLQNITKYTSGAAEANFIYRNYFSDSPQTPRLIAGYHFTYNPDKRNLLQKRFPEKETFPDYRQTTDGGMSEHSAVASYLFRINPYHNLRMTASDRHRIGDTHSNYYSGEILQDSPYSMKYTNNISSLNISYSGWINKLYLRLGASANYDYFSMSLPNNPDLDYVRRHFYFMPSATLYWRPDNNNSLNLTYSTSIARPGVEELNPFVSATNDFTQNCGNPDLKAQYSHDISLMWYFTAIKDLALVTSLQYTHVNDAILQSIQQVDNKMLYTYNNFGETDQMALILNVDYSPVEWMSVSANADLGKRFLSSKNPDLKQNDFYLNITPHIDFYLPNHFRVGGKYGFYKNLPAPWTTRSSLNIYSFYASKSFLNGRLNITLTANSPFNKYNHLRVTENLLTMKTEQNNYITARSFGINVSYTFGGGKSINLKRDRTLNSPDLKTGVR